MMKAFRRGEVAKQFANKLNGRGRERRGGGGVVGDEACRGLDNDGMEGVREGDGTWRLRTRGIQQGGKATGGGEYFLWTDVRGRVSRVGGRNAWDDCV